MRLDPHAVVHVYDPDQNIEYATWIDYSRRCPECGRPIRRTRVTYLSRPPGFQVQCPDIDLCLFCSGVRDQIIDQLRIAGELGRALEDPRLLMFYEWAFGPVSEWFPIGKQVKGGRS